MLEIKLFGATAVTSPNGTVLATELGGVKPRQILQILALSTGTPVPKDHLADLLWDGHPPRSYLGTLESYICVLRRSLGLGRGRGSILATVMRGYVLDPEAVSVDLLNFRSLARPTGAGLTGAAEELGRFEQALALVSGELLADETYGTWAVAERDVFRRELVTVASAAAAHALELGEHEVGLRRARQAIAADPLAEEAWCLLMRTLLASGRTTEALRAYLQLRGHLAGELGVDPSPESRGLYLQLLHADDSRSGGGGDVREEVRVLMGLLRQAVAFIPGLDESRSNRALARVAAELGA